MHTDDRIPQGTVYEGEVYFAAVVRIEGAGCYEVWRCDARTLRNERRVCTTNVMGIAVRVAQGIQRVRMYGEERAA